MKKRDGGRDSEPQSWPAERGTDPPVLMSYWPPTRTHEVVSEAQESARSALLAAPVWEDWYDQALDAGVEEDLAALGRDLIREAWARRWEDKRVVESGWTDEGAGMLKLAQRYPERAAMRWRELIEG